MCAAAVRNTNSKAAMRGGKDRPKSNSQTNLGRKGRKDDETVDQPSSSASLSYQQQAFLDQLDCPKRYIADEEIYALKIKEEDLQLIREKRPPTVHLPAQSVVVQKAKPSPFPANARLQKLTVAIPVPDDSDLHPRNYAVFAGARMDGNGNIIPHSILGNLDEFMNEAKCQQHLPQDYELTYPPPRSDSQLSVKYEKNKRSGSVSGYDKEYYGGLAEDKALKNWDRRMAERRCQQGYLSHLLNKPPEALAMNQGDGLRKVNELRHLIDRTMPYVNYGKGYRAGSEFWTMQPNLGGKDCGVLVTLTRSEKGCPPPIEHSGVPRCTLYEKGLRFESNSGTGTQTIHKPWHQSAYLRERVVRLAPLMDMVDPYVPETSELQVIGQPIVICPACGQARVDVCSCCNNNNDNQAECDDANDVNNAQTETAELKLTDRLNERVNEDQASADAPPQGPSVLFAGQNLRWTGSTSLYQQQNVACETRLGFEAEPCERSSKCIEIINNGTTAIYYSWRKLDRPDSFNRADDRIKRFYFDPIGGVILPGNCAKFVFLYRSPTHGIFTEQWQFVTHPSLCNGAPVVVTLRGVTLGRDDCSEQRLLLERLLAKREANQIARCALDQILERVHPVPRPRTPPSAYLTEEEYFNQRNPKLEYMEESCSKLRALHTELVPVELLSYTVWDLRPTSIHETVMIHKTDDTYRDDFLERLNDSVLSMPFRHFYPQQQTIYNVCYQLLGSAVDRMSDESERLKKQLTAACVSCSDVKLKSDHTLTGSGSSGSVDEKSNTQPQDGAGSKRATKAKKESKRTKDQRTKASQKAGKSGSVTNVVETSSSESLITDTQNKPVQELVMTEQVKDKYQDRLYARMYQFLCEMAEDMEESFEDVLGREKDKWPDCVDEMCRCDRC